MTAAGECVKAAWSTHCQLSMKRETAKSNHQPGRGTEEHVSRRNTWCSGTGTGTSWPAAGMPAGLPRGQVQPEASAEHLASEAGENTWPRGLDPSPESRDPGYQAASPGKRETTISLQAAREQTKIAFGNIHNPFGIDRYARNERKSPWINFRPFACLVRNRARQTTVVSKFQFS